MFKSMLQELCQRRSWNLPEYSTVKDGPDHIPRFTAVVVVNGQNFETPESCKSAKDAQNTAARFAYEHFNAPPPTRVHREASPAAAPHCAVAFSGVQVVVPVSVPASPLPCSLPVPRSGLLASKNGQPVNPSDRDITQQNCENVAQTSMIYRTPVGSHDILHMHKNRLQQYAQKENLAFPVYTCESEGPPHARRFKSRVNFDGKLYETLEFFPTLKEAEHAAAKVACQMLSVDNIEEGGGLYKNLLQELAQKKGYSCPSYETSRSGPAHMPVFVCTVEIGSNIFRGGEAKSRRQAEMNAAKVAYRALTHDSQYSRAPSSIGHAGVNNFTNNTLSIETIRRDKHPTIDGDFSCASDISVKRVRSLPENTTANLPAPPLDNPCSSSYVLAQVNPAMINHVPIQPQVPQRTLKTVVFPRKLNLPIPDSASVMPCSDDQWVAYKVELNHGPTA